MEFASLLGFAEKEIIIILGRIQTGHPLPEAKELWFKKNSAKKLNRNPAAASFVFATKADKI